MTLDQVKCQSWCAKQLNISFLNGRNLRVAFSPDLKVFEALIVNFVEEEVWQFPAQLVEAEEEALNIAELQFGLLARRVLSILHLLWRQRHKLLHKQKT